MTDSSTEAPRRRASLASLRRPAGATGAALTLVWVAALLFDPSVPAGAVARFVAIFTGGYFLALAAHELGHWAVSRAVGFKTIALIIGPLRFAPRAGRLDVRSTEGWNVLGGRLLTVPYDARQLRLRWMLVVAGGPAANFLLAGGSAALGLLAVRLAGLVPWPEFGLRAALLATGVCSVLGTGSLLIGLLNLIPLRQQGQLSDGAQLLLLLRGGPQAERWCAQMSLTMSARAGRGPREWDPRWIEQATALRDDSAEEALGQLWAHHWAVGRGDVAGAARHLEAAFALSERLPPLHRAVLLTDAAFFAARVRGNAEMARACLAMARSGPPGDARVPRFALLRSEAAVHLAEGRSAEARAAAEAALRALAEFERDEDVSAPSEAEWLRDIIADAERGGAEPRGVPGAAAHYPAPPRPSGAPSGRG